MSTKNRQRDARSLALDTLLAIGRSEKPGHLAIRAALEENMDLDERERRFYRKLVEGCLELRLRLDYIINEYSKTKTGKMKPVIREILRMAVYQIYELSSVPDSAAVNEAVKLTVRRGFSNLRGFVNGVLRTIVREKGNVKWPEKDTDPVRYISIMYSMPEPIAARWCRELGTEQTETVCGAFLKQAPVTVRLRGGKRDTGPAGFHSAGFKEIEQKLEAEGVQVQPAPYVNFARNLSGTAELDRLKCFRDGQIAVQDVSSMIAVLAAGIREGDFVLDLCAAPGGKSLLAADLLGGSGHVTARDLTGQKAELILENAARLGVKNIEVQVRDASLPDEAMTGIADVVLADLPCSGLGVIGRKPDIRYHASDQKTESLVRLQRQILTNAVRYIKPGGTLIYSTCTIDRRENEENAEWLEKTAGLMPDPLGPYLPEELAREAKGGNTLQLLPGIHRCDGFFIARFRRPV